MTCSTCGAASVVLLTHSIRIGKRTVTWSECAPCWRKAEAAE